MGIYQGAAADLPVQLTVQGTRGRSNTGSLRLCAQVMNLIQKPWKHSGKNHKGLEYSGNSKYLGDNPTNSQYIILFINDKEEWISLLLDRKHLSPNYKKKLMCYLSRCSYKRILRNTSLFSLPNDYIFPQNTEKCAQ